MQHSLRMVACPEARYEYSTAPGISLSILLQNLCNVNSVLSVVRLCSGHVLKVNFPIGFR